MVTISQLIGKCLSGIEARIDEDVEAKIYQMLCPGYSHAPKEIYCKESPQLDRKVQGRKSLLEGFLIQKLNALSSSPSG